jgi:phosphoserine phosphatase RsbU/P
MDPISDSFLREQLQFRRQKLETATAQLPAHGQVLELLQEVDSALDRMAKGTYGICETCHDPIEKDRLIADPLLRYCLDHLSADQLRALEQDLDLAAKVQGGLLPAADVTLPGWDVHYYYQAAGAVSGDYCDLVNAGEEGLFFFVGDVSGKGIAASMLMAHLHAMFRALLSLQLPLHRMMERANRLFCESTLADAYATLVCGRLSRSGGLEICNAGHCPPLLRRGREVTRIESTGLPIGIFCSGEYELRKAELDVLLLYTDGVSEARDPSDREYGEDRLLQLLATDQTLSAKELARICYADLTTFRSGAARNDDVTIMTVRRS